MTAVRELDRYRYIGTLGVGGMATVSLAEDLVLGRKVALKRVAASGIGGERHLLDQDRDRNGVTRLRREALLGASVSHQNIVSVYDVVTTDDGDVVIVMEYVDGETLRHRMVREGRMAPRAALPILAGVAAGLDSIHQRGIVHRDVKPANVLLGADRTVKLADLGVATVPDGTRITSAGAVVGTFRYMAPEQLEDGPSQPGVDIYALAVVAFEMLSGQKARPDSHPMALAHAIATQPPPDLRDAWSEAPSAAAELLMQAMARDPARRPRSAGELVGRLRAALLPEPTRQIPVVPPPQAAPEPRPGPPPKAAVAPPLPPPTSRGHSRTPALAAVLGLAATAAAILGLALANSSAPPAAHTRLSAHRGLTTRPAAHHSPGPSTVSSGTASGVTAGSTAGGSTTSGSTAIASTSAGSSAGGSPAAAGNPVSAVESFYHLAAAHNYAQAWALADPTFQSQLGGYSSFAAGQAADRSIIFDSARVLSQTGSAATVAVTTTSIRTNGTQHCGGTVDLRPAGSSGTWLLHLIHINCS